MRIFLFILLFLSCYLNAQDKLFFKDGTRKKGFILSIAKDYIYFRTSDTAATQKISRGGLILIEDYKGTLYHFSEDDKITETESTDKKTETGIRNIFSIQPIGLILGRATVVYERLTKDDKIGVVIPFSLTYDPTGILSQSELDTSFNAVKRIRGVNFITGLDVNFYVGKKESLKFFLGPRVRYGTDLFLRDIQGYTIQTQFGWKLNRPEKKFVQHFSIGLGFVRVLSSPGGTLIDPKQSYGWYSLNYRLGIKW
jgi:hypothetical protein